MNLLDGIVILLQLRLGQELAEIDGFGFCWIRERKEEPQMKEECVEFHGQCMVCLFLEAGPAFRAFFTESPVVALMLPSPSVPISPVRGENRKRKYTRWEQLIATGRFFSSIFSELTDLSSLGEKLEEKKTKKNRASGNASPEERVLAGARGEKAFYPSSLRKSVCRTGQGGEMGDFSASEDTDDVFSAQVFYTESLEGRRTKLFHTIYHIWHHIYWPNFISHPLYGHLTTHWAPFAPLHWTLSGK